MREGLESALLIKMIIDNNHVDFDILCKGLCSSRLIYYMQNAQRIPDHSIQRRMMERLGYDIWDCEIYLPKAEYEREQQKNEILHHILNKNISLAMEQLEQFRERFVKDGIIEEQFYEVMNYQIMRLQGENLSLQKAVLTHAIELTIPMEIHTSLEESYLSMVELNLLTEYLMIDENTEAKQYWKIIEYIERRNFEEASCVKLYPKLIWLWGKKTIQKNGDARKVLSYCNNALEMLRNQSQMRYLWEILCLRIEMLSLLKDTKLSKDLENTLRWKQSLEIAYRENGVSFETTDFCDFYFVQELFCINDVIRIRRKMMGISQKQLCKDICTLRTLQRIEAKQTSPQRIVSEQLFERLGLCTQFIHQELCTNDVRIKELFDVWRRHSNEQNFQEESKVFCRIMKYVSEEKNNEQGILAEKVFLDWKAEKMDRILYQKKMLKIMEMTVSLKVILNTSEQYLTENELYCLNYLFLATKEEAESQEHLQYLRILESYYENLKEEHVYLDIAPMYDMIMVNVGSDYGNRKLYEKSDQINSYILKNSISIRRGKKIPRMYYARWWNLMQKSQEHIADTADLQVAIDLAELFKNYYDLAIYKKNLTS